MHDTARIERGKRIVELNREGLTVMEIAAKYEVGPAQVKLAIRHGGAPSRAIREPRRYQQETRP